MNELIKKALDLKPQVTFSSYYKYVFTYEGTVVVDGVLYKILASLGGDASDIYGVEVVPGVAETLTKNAFNCITLFLGSERVADWSEF